MLFRSQEDLEKGMAAHSSILARRIPWAEEPGTIIVLLLISPFIVAIICLTYCSAPILGEKEML